MTWPLRSLLLLVGSLLVAAPAAGTSLGTEIAGRVRQFLDGKAMPGGAEVEISVGEPDPKLNLAPCKAYEPFVPAGARLWGKTSLGVRCTQGARWIVYLPTYVKVFSDVQVAAHALARGKVVGAADTRVERVEVTAYPAGVLGPGDSVAGWTLTRSTIAGEPLRKDMLRAPIIIEAGDLVQVRVNGAGFTVGTDGKALSSASEGQIMQINVAGRVLRGVARSGKLVEVQ